MCSVCVRALMILLGTPLSGQAETVVATRTLPAQTIVSAGDLSLETGDVPGVVSEIGDAVGLETRVTIYPGRPLRRDDLGPPTIITRNQTVTLAYQQGGLRIQTEGRALDRAGIGDTIRVMNIASKSTVMATIAADGTAFVAKQ
ncbi:MAG: flagellar basal body P-ring formation chaperone FlgA [Paracoccaceae bacterium]|nr:flagellar basal body P-ring formation chaperone FlgA [Paracoccaceae bacterium]